MSDESADKTEEPTAKRQSKFREEGQVPQSRDIAGVAVLTGATILAVMILPLAFDKMRSFIEQCAAGMDQLTHGDPRTQLPLAIYAMTSAFVGIAGPFLALSFVLSISAGLAQTGGNITDQALKLRFNFLNPAQAFSKIFSKGQGAVQLLLALGKTLALGFAVFAIIAPAFDTLAPLFGVSLLAMLQHFYLLNLKLIVTALLGAAVLAAIDYWVTYRRIHEEMKMTKQEVKDEFKQMEGNPEIKRKIRARMARIGRNRMLAQVAKASVVVVNPTHYAVALTYRPGLDAAPVLTAKGKDALAKKIRDIARRNQVPIVANPPVARMLFRLGKVGQAIPLELFDVVARVLAYIYRMRDESNLG
jgi:flagellar biosynthesis protein FlhB